MNINPIHCISAKMMLLNRVVSNVFRKYIKPYGITNSQLTLLFILSKADNLNQKHLAEITILEKSSLSRNIKRLAEAGLIDESKFPIIKLSDDGEVLINSVLPEWEKAMIEIKEILGKSGEEALNILTSKLLT